MTTAFPADMDSLDDVAARLTALRIEGGSPSYTAIALAVSRVRRQRGLIERESRAARSTIYAAFQPGRRRLDAQLVGELVVALNGSAQEAQDLVRAVGRLQQTGRRVTR